jgi:hypothetical protein
VEGIVEFKSDWAILELDSRRLIAKGGFTLGFGSKTPLKHTLLSNSKLNPKLKDWFSKSRGAFCFCWDQQDLMEKWCHISDTKFFMS